MNPASPVRGSVAIFRKDLLPLSETFVKDQVRSLRRWNPVLIGFRYVETTMLDGLEHRLVRSASSTGAFRRGVRALRYAVGVVDPEVERSVRVIGPSLIHAHFGVDATFIHPTARRLQIPLLVTLHGYDIQVDERAWKSGGRGQLGRLYPRLLRRLVSDRCVHFVAVSEAIKARALERGIPEERIHVRYIGVDTQKFASSAPPAGKRGPLVLFVGRLVEKKGADVLLSAMTIVGRSCPGATLAIIGDGPMREALEGAAAQSGLAIEFLGYQTHEQVRQWMGRARILCAPSVRGTDGDAEGLPIAILEAGAMGLPVVTSAVGGATEGIVHSETGFAVEERRPDALAERIVELLTDDNRASEMSARAVAFVREKFDQMRCSEALECLYDQVAELRMNRQPLREAKPCTKSSGIGTTG